jgi:5-formyltetrahydrofolate cyclo-ligase
VDIRSVKSNLREYYKTIRLEMTDMQKSEMDGLITQRITGLWQYKKCQTLLTYVSKDIEVDTINLINLALAEGKTVAVPRCIDGTRNMEFYQINSLEDDLLPGTFGVMEPEPQKCVKLTNYSNSLCIVPALCYDWKGFRLGYGKGYYDRFLDTYNGFIVGIVYSNCVRRSLPHGRFDRPVNLLVTENYIRRTSGRK